MSCNLTIAFPFGIICVSDRRLTGLEAKKIKTNRSTKMTVFGCADAYGTIVYNGIGSDDAGKTPSDWLLELAEKSSLIPISRKSSMVSGLIWKLASEHFGKSTAPKVHATASSSAHGIRAKL